MERKHIKAVKLTDEEKESMEREAARVDRPVASYLRWLHACHLERVESEQDGAE
jgi:hypothetical protein